MFTLPNIGFSLYPDEKPAVVVPAKAPAAPTPPPPTEPPVSTFPSVGKEAFPFIVSAQTPFMASPMGNNTDFTNTVGTSLFSGSAPKTGFGSPPPPRPYARPPSNPVHVSAPAPPKSESDVDAVTLVVELSERVVGMEKTLGLSVAKLQSKVLDLESKLQAVQHEVEDLRQRVLTSTPIEMDMDNLSEYFIDTVMQAPIQQPASLLYGADEHKSSCPSPLDFIAHDDNQKQEESEQSAEESEAEPEPVLEPELAEPESEEDELEEPESEKDEPDEPESEEEDEPEEPTIDTSKIRTISFSSRATPAPAPATPKPKGVPPKVLQALQGKSERDLMKLKASEIAEYLEAFGKSYVPPKNEGVKQLMQLAGL